MSEVVKYLDKTGLATVWGKVKGLVAPKADKVSGATSGHLAGLNSSGNLMDSGLAADSISAIVDMRMPDAEEGIDDINGYLGRETLPAVEVADFREYPMLCGQPAILFCDGAPTAANKPENWIDFLDGGYEWTGLPSAVGQHVRDITNGQDYYGRINPATGLLEWK